MTTHRAPSRLVGSRSRVRLHRRQSAGLRERVNVTYLTGAYTTIGRDGHANTHGGVGWLASIPTVSDDSRVANHQPRQHNRSNLIARRIKNLRRTATRMTVSIGVAVLVVMATVLPVPPASASSSAVPPPTKPP